MSRRLAAALAGSLIAFAAGTAVAAEERPAMSRTFVDDAEIRTVVDAFKAAIIAKDRATLEKLAADDQVELVSAVDTRSLRRMRLKRPETKRVDTSSYAKFVDQITSSTDRLEETVANLVIRSDSTIATVYFDYTFRENDRITNWGHETWTMVRGDDGWRIANIVYSVTLPARP